MGIWRYTCVGLCGLPHGTAALRNLEPGFAASLLALSFFSALPQQANLLQNLNITGQN